MNRHFANLLAVFAVFAYVALVATVGAWAFMGDRSSAWVALAAFGGAGSLHGFTSWLDMVA